MFKHFRNELRPWNWSTRRWLLTLMLAVLISPFATRCYYLWQVPDVGMPFDIEEFLGDERVDPDDDATLKYGSAIAAVRAIGVIWESEGNSTTKVASAIERLTLHPDGEWDATLEQWLTDNAEALTLFREAGARSRASGASLRTADSRTLLPFHNELINLARLVRMQAVRCERQGDMMAAWTCYRAILQSARHAEHPKIAICRLIASGARRDACDGIALWAQNNAVTAEQLRLARREVLAEAARRTSRSDCQKGEYLLLRNTLRRRDAPDELVPAWSSGLMGHSGWLAPKQLLLWIIGQPETVVRIQRQILANNLDQIDLPKSRRAATLASRVAVVFQDSAGRHRPGQMSAEQLNLAIDNSMVRTSQNMFSISPLHFDQAIQREDAMLAALVVLLACEEYRRDHDRFPQELQELVPGYFDQIPFDPAAEISVPLQYRLESDGQITVWSIGPNGVDNEGSVATNWAEADVGYRTGVKK